MLALLNIIKVKQTGESGNVLHVRHDRLNISCVVVL